MEVTREKIQSMAQLRMRNQLSNVLIFGTLIGFAGAGLMGGAMSGVFAVGHSSLIESPSLIKLLVVVLTTLLGFCAGIAVSFYVSPLVLRQAFFAKSVGEWKGVRVFVAEDADLPGGHPNLFIAGFRRGMGPFRPSIFVGRSAFRMLGREALEAAFAHELGHLDSSHLRKRLITGVATFLLASLLTSAMLIGMQLSGYAEINGAISLLSGFIPAALTWLSTKNLTWDQEFEADTVALNTYQASPESLLHALGTFQAAIGGTAHPLVEARMHRLRLLLAESPTETASPSNYAA